MTIENPFEGSAAPEEKKDDKQEQLDYRAYQVGQILAPLFGKLGQEALAQGWEKVGIECAIVLNNGRTVDVSFAVTDSVDTIAQSFENALKQSLADIDLSYDVVEKATLNIKGLGNGGESLGAATEEYQK